MGDTLLIAIGGLQINGQMTLRRGGSVFEKM